MSENERYAVVWCDSPLGLISMRVYDSGEPVTFAADQLPPEIEKVRLAEDAFRILNRKDGTKVAVPDLALFAFFGWDV